MAVDRRELGAALGTLATDTVRDVAGVFADQIAVDDRQWVEIREEAQSAMLDALVEVAERRGWDGG